MTTKNISVKNLRKLNLIAAGLHLLQGVAVASQNLEPARTMLFHLSLPWLVAIFFFLSACFHLVIATVYNRRYNQNLRLGINKARWLEYSLSASIMMVAIAMLVGVYDLSSLAMVFVLIAIMNLMGLMMEIHNQTTQTTSWLSYWIGCLAGVVPWLVVAFYMWLGAHEGSRAPTFVYWIFVSIFLFFSCFAANMALQYKKIGPWRDYLYGERAYIILSLVAKSLLAWQVFAGTLRP
jgi:Heliorhodopsin